MTLDSGKWLLGDVQNTTGTHRWILTICILAIFQRVATNVGNDDVGVWDIMMDVENDVIGVWRVMMNVRNNSVGIRNVMTDISMCISLKFCLEVEG